MGGSTLRDLDPNDPPPSLLGLFECWSDDPSSFALTACALKVEVRLSKPFLGLLSYLTCSATFCATLSISCSLTNSLASRCFSSLVAPLW